MPITEKQLVAHLVQGRTRLVSFIWAIVRDMPAAEDIYQTLCGEAVEKRPDITDEAHLVNWLRQGARFRAIDHLRSRSSDRLVFDDSVYELLETDLADDPATGSDMQHALETCLAKLAPDAKQLVDLRYQQSMTCPQIAKQLDRNVSTVYVTFTRIHRSLADCITQQLER